MSSNPILIVDDDPAILELIAELLSYEGYNVITSDDGSRAISLARDKLPKLILLDLMMPEMSGWQVMAALKASPRTRAIPVVLLSARRGLPSTADELGANAFLEKPFDLDDLLDLVQRFVNPDDQVPVVGDTSV